MRRAFGLLMLLVLCDGCKGCRANAVSETGDSQGQDSAREDSGGTGQVEAPRCAVPESEPNDAPEQADPIPLERLGCGDISAPLDQDLWTFELTEHAWIGIYLEAEAIGSKADPALVLISDDGETAEHRGDEGAKDVHMKFPAKPGRYTLIATDEDARGGEVDYGYELLITSVKAPLTWNHTESEPNDGAPKAHPASHGDRWFGTIADAFDSDWYRIDVPAGKHALTLDVDAFDFGSAGNFKLVLWSKDLVKLRTRIFGEQGWERDPFLEHTSTGDEVLYVQVAEATSRGAQPYWYVLDVSLEGG